jgi:hypothetical protein
VIEPRRMVTKKLVGYSSTRPPSNGTLRGRMNARGFKQVKEQHYDGTTISSPVTNSATIRIVLAFMNMASMIAHVVDVKGAFLHGEFEDGEIISKARRIPAFTIMGERTARHDDAMYQ